MEGRDSKDVGIPLVVVVVVVVKLLAASEMYRHIFLGIFLVCFIPVNIIELARSNPGCREHLTNKAEKHCFIYIILSLYSTVCGTSF